MIRRNLIAILVCVLCVAGFITSQVIRVGTAQQNCDNITNLRDAFDGILTLADELTPPDPASDKFYQDAHNKLKEVKC